MAAAANLKRRMSLLCQVSILELTLLVTLGFMRWLKEESNHDARDLPIAAATTCERRVVLCTQRHSMEKTKTHLFSHVSVRGASPSQAAWSIFGLHKVFDFEYCVVNSLLLPFHNRRQEVVRTFSTYATYHIL